MINDSALYKERITLMLTFQFISRSLFGCSILLDFSTTFSLCLNKMQLLTVICIVFFTFGLKLFICAEENDDYFKQEMVIPTTGKTQTSR